MSTLKLIRYVSLHMWEYHVKLQGVARDLTTKGRSHSYRFGKGTDNNNQAHSPAFWGPEMGHSPATQNSLSQHWGWALLLPASCQTSFLGWSCSWKGEIGDNENKNGETNRGKERVRRPWAKVETGSCFTWGWFSAKWAGSFSNIEKREMGTKRLVPPLLSVWPCSFWELLL